MNDKKKHTILVIEDSELNIAKLRQILDTDYDVVVARCGYEGIETAKNIIPDVILLDIILPDIDGFETITILKKTVATRKIPVIFITGLTKTEDEGKGLRLGGVDYITKPFCVEVVKLRVQNQIRMLDYISTIEQLSRIDQLTGLHNRRSYHERLISEWKLAIREGSTISVLIMDIDHFKACNDTFGHLHGDIILQKVAKVISKSAKRPTDFVARWGGEEFIILLPKTESEGALIVAESVRKSVENATITLNDGRSTSVTISIGVNTHTPTQECAVYDFLHRADKAMYRAKEEGRNRVIVHRE